MSDQPGPDASPLAAAPEPPRSPPPARRLQRSRDDRVIAGVCGGLAEYFGIDPVLVRIATLVLVFAGGAGLLLYVIGWIAIPVEPEAGAGERPSAEPRERTTGSFTIGIVFVLLGAFFLVDEVWSDFLSWEYVWPIALIALGVAVIVRERR